MAHPNPARHSALTGPHPPPNRLEVPSTYSRDGPRQSVPRPEAPFCCWDGASVVGLAWLKVQLSASVSNADTAGEGQDLVLLDIEIPDADLLQSKLLALP